MSLNHVQSENFTQQVLQSEQPVLVDFHAEWCPPCRMMDQTVEDVATQIEGTAKVVKVNVDEAGDIAAEYGIQSIPTFVVFHQGTVQNRLTGVVPEKQLLGLLNV